MGAITADRQARLLEKLSDKDATLEEMFQRITGSMVDHDGQPIYQGLPEICRDWDVPYGRVMTWLMADVERYAVYLRALEVQAKALAGDVVRIADAQPVAVVGSDGRPVRDEDGEIVTIRNDVARDKLRVETRLRLAKYHDAKVYGDRVDHNHTGVPVFAVTINMGGGPDAGGAVINADDAEGAVL